MRNQLIAMLVAALILFFWQFLSWSVLGVHASDMQYTPKQDTLLRVLSDHLEEGSYFLPTIPPGATAEEMQAAMTAAEGKPWATISYHASMQTNTALNLIRGFVVDLVAVFLLIWGLLKIEDLNFQSALFGSLAIGFIGFLTIPYLNTIWFETDSIGYLIDTIVQWGLVGVWLGWFLTRK